MDVIVKRFSDFTMWKVGSGGKSPAQVCCVTFVEMTDAERRAGCLSLLAHIDQQIAECEDPASQPDLADDEQEYLAVQVTLRHQWRERVE